MQEELLQFGVHTKFELHLLQLGQESSRFDISVEVVLEWRVELGRQFQHFNVDALGEEVELGNEIAVESHLQRCQERGCRLRDQHT